MRRRARFTAALALGTAAFALAPAALAATARAGATYKGSLAGARHIAITLRVSAGGRAVVALHIASLPIYCSGSGPPGTPTLTFRPSAISQTGEFSASGADMIDSGPLKGSIAATFKVSGTFTAGGGEHGVIVTAYGGAAKHCSGRSRYSTRVAG
ncbi:MAG TPA: hypothetical protein VID68_09590 [Solirubrobacteraceae bacterium]|jgi:hypothetical protein